MNNIGENIGSDGRKKIILFDTTLRDGHQCPGAAIEKDEDYFKIARGIDSIGFDICEVGFPSSSKHEFWRVNEVAKMAQSGEINTIVAGLSQMVEFQVEATLRALEPAAEVGKGFFHIYFPVDPNLRKASIGNKFTDNEAIENVAKFAKMASEHGMIVQFSPEGYSKVGDNFNFCTDLLVTAAENGVTYFNMPDTIGGQDQDNDKVEYFVNTIMRHKKIIDERFPGNNFIWSVHNHNDLGNAVQNSINGVKIGTGISKIEGTINGIGERAGNANHNEIIVRLKTTLSHSFNIDHIKSGMIKEVSMLVSGKMLPTQPNQPIVGANAMRHTSGGHTNAMLNDPTVYQPFNPEIVGGEISLVYGPNSGSNLAINIIEKNGYHCPKENRRELDGFLKDRMKETGRYKGITDEQLLDLYFEFRNPIKIQDYTKNNIDGSNEILAEFKGHIFGQENLQIRGETVFIALKDFISKKIPGYDVEDYLSKSEDKGSHSFAITEIVIVCKDTGEKITGIGRDNDIEISSLKSLTNAFNKIYIRDNYRK